MTNQCLKSFAKPGLTKNYGYIWSNKINLHYCGNCSSIWVDLLEFLIMSKKFLRLDLIEQDLRENTYKGADIISIHVLTDAFAKFFRQRLRISRHTSHTSLFFDDDD